LEQIRWNQREALGQDSYTPQDNRNADFKS
jgi:hypothetical protein